jgi:hypothetical protein
LLDVDFSICAKYQVYSPQGDSSICVLMCFAYLWFSLILLVTFEVSSHQ